MTLLILAAALSRREPLLVEPELTGPRPFHLDDLLGDERGLVLLVLSLIGDDRLPGCLIGPEALGLAPGVVADHRVRRIKDELV